LEQHPHSFDYQQAYEPHQPAELAALAQPPARLEPAFEALHHDVGAARVSPFQASGDCYMFQEPTT